jgi:hypothetical protein
MALFLVQKGGKGRTLGVYHVISDVGDVPFIRFLIWDGKEWTLGMPKDYVPVELDNIFEEDPQDE